MSIKSDFPQDVKQAEAWAVGTRGGEPVGEDNPAYENSARYWAGSAAGSASTAREQAQAAADAARAAMSANVAGASVGDIIRVKAVDEDGVPTAWEATAGVPKLLGSAEVTEDDVGEIQLRGYRGYAHYQVILYCPAPEVYKWSVLYVSPNSDIFTIRPFWDTYAGQGNAETIIVQVDWFMDEEGKPFVIESAATIIGTNSRANLERTGKLYCKGRYAVYGSLNTSYYRHNSNLPIGAKLEVWGWN